jgi:glycolate oxidase iron-sulfur subunit
MRRNIDAWIPALERGAEAIVINASGCAPQVKDYATLLADDPRYAHPAREISARALDVAEILAAEEAALSAALARSTSPLRGRKVAFHSPCSLQHGQRITGVVERLLTAAGCELQPVANSHLCCGSAGTYSLLQPDLANTLRSDKLAALQAGEPETIATANIGCLSHLQGATALPVRHWIELLDEALGE